MSFRSLEDTRELAIRTAHAEIERLAEKSETDGLSPAEANQLRTMLAMVNDTEELEIKKFVTRKNAGADRDPDPAAADEIALGKR